MEIEIIHEPTEAQPFIIINKPSHLPSAPLKEGDDSALTRAASLFPEVKSVKGRKEVEMGLIHRIDNDTSGLLLVATTQEFFDHLCREQEAGRFVKNYLAVCKKISTSKDDSFPPFTFENEVVLENISACIEKYTVHSKFRPFGEKSRSVRPVTDQSGKYVLKKASPVEYTTSVCLEKLDSKKNNGDCMLAKCSLSRGYRHQVRVHLAWSGHPIEGDLLYGENLGDVPAQFKFCASGLAFTDCNGVEHNFSITPDWL